MPALWRGLDLSITAGSLRAFRMWIMFKSTFFLPERIARLADKKAKRHIISRYELFSYGCFPCYY